MKPNDAVNSSGNPIGSSDDPDSRVSRDGKVLSNAMQRRGSKDGIGLTPSEIKAAFQGADAAKFPPILTVDEVCKLFKRSRSTVYHWISEGHLDGTFRRRGKHHTFWRDRLFTEYFNGPDWNENEHKNI